MEEKAGDFLFPYASLNNYFHKTKMKVPENKIKKFRLKLSLNSELLPNQMKSKSQKSMELLIKKILINNNKKHNSTPNIKNKMIINDLIRSKENHLTATFKDYLILDNVEEFLKRFYLYKESLAKFPKFYNYYKKYLLFFCKPTFRENYLNKIVQDYGECKAELYYNDYYGYKKKEKSKNENKKNTEIPKTIFTESIRSKIAKIQDNTLYISSNETTKNYNEINEPSIILQNTSQNNSKSTITLENSIIKIVKNIKEKNDTEKNLNDVNNKNNDRILKQKLQTLCETCDNKKNNSTKINKKLNIINETLTKINNMKNTKNSFKISQKQLGSINKEKLFNNNFSNTINSYREKNDTNRVNNNNKKYDTDLLQLNLNNINYNGEKFVKNYLSPLSTPRMNGPEIFSTVKIINKSRHIITSDKSQRKLPMDEHIKSILKSIKANTIESHKKSYTTHHFKSPPNTSVNNLNININNRILLSNNSNNSKYCKNKSNCNSTNLKTKKVSRNSQNKINNFDSEELLHLSNNKYNGKNSEININNMKKIENEHRQASKYIFTKNKGFQKKKKIINAFQHKHCPQKNIAVSSRGISGNEINKLFEDLQGASPYTTLKLINNNRDNKDKRTISSYKAK